MTLNTVLNHMRGSLHCNTKSLKSVSFPDYKSITGFPTPSRLERSQNAPSSKSGWMKTESMSQPPPPPPLGSHKQSHISCGSAAFATRVIKPRFLKWNQYILIMRLKVKGLYLQCSRKGRELNLSSVEEQKKVGQTTKRLRMKRAVTKKQQRTVWWPTLLPPVGHSGVAPPQSSELKSSSSAARKE